MTAPENYSGFDAYIGQDAMNAYMEGLASRLPAGGRAELRQSPRTVKGLGRLCGQSGLAGPAAENIKWITLLARRLFSERPARLPACFSRPRISLIAAEIVAHSYFSVNARMMAGALGAFDSKQGLTMDEIWLFPRAATIELIEAFYQIALRGAQASRGIYARLSERRATDEAFLADIVASLREVSDIDWKREYESLCRTEKILSADKVYSAQDEASKAAVRRGIAKLSRQSGLSEWTIARHAASMAGENDFSPMNTCVYWLFDRDGQAAILRATTGLSRAKRPEAGKVYIACFAGVFVCLSAIACEAVGLWLIIPLAVIAWRLSRLILDRLVSRVFAPRPLLKLKFERVPDEYRTLVVIPALLSSAARAGEIVRQLETLGAATRSDALEYLLLGDFRDSPLPQEDCDASIVALAREGIDALNRAEGRKRYHYLHRSRSWVEIDGKFMARERKRGALMELNELILGREARFEADGSDAEFIRGRFRCVLTLDADARILPDAQRALVGAMFHPLNRRRVENGVKKGYSVISPRVEQRRVSRFGFLTAFPGGLDAYPTPSSGAYWDMCEIAAYCGKGIYDVKAFQEALANVVPQNAILSHDLLEGALAGAAAAYDVVVLDDFPRTRAGYLRRLHRWTRGDWQLLPYIFALPLSPLNRFMMLDNLVSSLAGAMTILLMVFSGLAGSGFALAFALINAFAGHFDSPRRALANLALLPDAAYTCVDAIIRALYRSFHSGRGLLEWTPAADAEGGGQSAPTGKLCAAALLPGLFQGPMAPFAAGIGLVFWAGAGWLERDDDAQEASEEERNGLLALAGATWRYFEAVVPPDGSALPPDNLQIDPYAGLAKRTSPTNICMYMLSCLSAELLGIIAPAEARRRIEMTLTSLESLQKWRGQLYNWYDSETRAPLQPRYVSSVDGGNLAAGLMLLSGYYGESIAARCEALIGEMDLAALFDREKKLFYIGFDETNGRMSDSHYDLLASESRILSLAAIALGKVPEEHWRRLGRRVSGATLLSWSGTAFEYLMPEIFAKSAPGTLLHESELNITRERQGLQKGVWGVSESGYYAFDARLNYQYRAFGLKRDALGQSSDGKVIAPYATLLALAVNPQMSLANLRLMRELGWEGEYGLYEAVDFDPQRIPKEAEYKIVKSYMSHHQGMIMTSIAEYLTGGALSRAFCLRPDVRAYLPLLEERPRREPEVDEVRSAPSARGKTGRDAPRLAASDFEGHLLYGGGTTVLATGGGVTVTRRGETDIDRFSGFFAPNDGTVAGVEVEGVKSRWSRGLFEAGAAKWTCSGFGVACVMRLVVSPGDGAVSRVFDLKNESGERRSVKVYSASALALAPGESYAAHPAFMNMFVYSELTDVGRAAFERRGRQAGERVVFSVYAPAEARVSLENDLSRLIGRRGGLGDIEIYPDKFSFTPGYPLDPCLCQKVELTLEAGQSEKVSFAVEFGSGAISATVGDIAEKAAKDKELARARMAAELGFLSMDASRCQMIDKQSAALFYQRNAVREICDIRKNDLWEMGLDTRYPIIAAFVSRESEISAARRAADRYVFYSRMGVKCLLALVDGEAGGYLKPVWDALGAIAASLGDGGCVILASRALSEKNLKALRLCAAIIENEPEQVNYPAQREIFLRPDRVRTADATVNSCGLGGFSRDYREYAINSVRDFPAPWCNILANGDFGAVVSERAGGFCFARNSRLERVTPWTGDALYEGELFRLHIKTPAGENISLVPALPPARVSHRLGESVYESAGEGLKWKVVLTVPRGAAFLSAAVEITNASGLGGEIEINLGGNFLMGADAHDARMLSYGFSDSLMTAKGAMPGVGFLYMEGAKEKDGGLFARMSAPAGKTLKFEALLGCARDENDAREKIAASRESAADYWEKLLSRVAPETPDAALNAFVGRWLPYQTLSSRVFARSGFYQSGGAYGFRDQLQDMLVLITLEPSIARRHILYCASRQFESGDALHWWHPPATGVRTRISDDRVFLPYITAIYVSATGDASILEESVEYLKDVPLPDGDDDVYAEAAPSGVFGSLHEHCMRAVRLSARKGRHGLAEMGGGDWNDGMNRVGGESVWLSEFLVAACDDYAAVLEEKFADDVRELKGISDEMKRAVEQSGWDGEWYYRAFYGDGEFIGGKGGESCEIDLLSQCWAVMAGLDRERCLRAMENAWQKLVKDGVIRLLTPPFVQGSGKSPGYIADYPPGVRENGGQYTHAACWAVMAWARLGDASRAWEAVDMLLPFNRASNRKQARRYRAEPYVLAADVYDGRCPGRAGWTWYTGAAAWLYQAVIHSLLGLERKGTRARLNALLRPEWNEAAITLRAGESTYRLIARRGETKATLDGAELKDGWLELLDDGKPHQAVFPPRGDTRAKRQGS